MAATVEISIECADNPHGVPGVIVYDDKTYPISSHEGTAFGAGHGHHSSVRAFQISDPVDEETAMECDPPDLK